MSLSVSGKLFQTIGQPIENARLQNWTGFLFDEQQRIGSAEFDEVDQSKE